jgi:hypothetical protein
MGDWRITAVFHLPLVPLLAHRNRYVEPKGFHAASFIRDGEFAP